MESTTSRLIELEELVNEEGNRLLTLEERARIEASKYPPEVLRMYLPPKFQKPTHEALIDIIIKYGEKYAKKPSYYKDNSNNIFYVRPIETLKLYQQMADIVIETKKPTVYPEDAVNRRIIEEDNYLDAVQYIEKLNQLSPNDKQIFTWWTLAANSWYYDDEPIESQFKILRTTFNMMYDINMDDAFPFLYELGLSPQQTDGHGPMCISYTIEANRDHRPDEGAGISEYLNEFMLVSACANMIGKPEQHVFSTRCKCWVCLMNPEYYRILDTPPTIIKSPKQSKIDGNLTYISTGYLTEVIPRFVVLGNELIDGATPLFLSAKGVVQLTDEYMTDLIQWTLKHVPNNGGVMFKSDKILEPDVLIELFDKTLDAVKVLNWTKTYKKFQDKNVLIIVCETEDRLFDYADDD